MGTPDGSGIGSHRIGRKVKRISIASGCQYNSMGAVRFNLAGNEVTYYNAPGPAIHQNQVQHFGAGEYLHLAVGNLSTQGAISS